MTNEVGITNKAYDAAFIDGIKYFSGNLLLRLTCSQTLSVTDYEYIEEVVDKSVKDFKKVFMDKWGEDN